MKKYILLREDLEAEQLVNAENLKTNNDIKSMIEDINMFKKFENKIIDLYTKAETQEDIVKALKGMKIMDNNGKVLNGLISLHLSYASKVRQVIKTDEEIKKIEDSIKELNSTESSEITTVTIKEKTNTKNELGLQLNELNKATDELKKKMKDKVKEYENRIKELKNIKY